MLFTGLAVVWASLKQAADVPLCFKWCVMLTFNGKHASDNRTIIGTGLTGGCTGVWFMRLAFRFKPWVPFLVSV